MKIEIKNTKGLMYEIIFYISKEEIDKQANEKMARLSKTLNLNGFRKGLIPKNIIQTRFGKNIYNEVLNKIYQQNLLNVIKEKNLDIVGKPELRSIFKKNKTYVKIFLDFEVYPNINLNFTKMKVKNFYSSIEKKDILNEIFRLRKVYGNWMPGYSNARKGDKLGIDLYNITNNNIIYLLKDYEITLDDDICMYRIKNLEEFLINKGLNKKYNISFKNNFISNGKINDKILKINKISRFHLAKIDENFFEKVQYENRNLYFNNFVKTKLENKAKNISKCLMKINIINELINTHKFDVPNNLVKKMKIYSYNSHSPGEVKHDLKLRLILDKIKNKFNIRLKENNVEDYDINKASKREKISDVRSSLLTEEILDIIKNKITIIDEEVTFNKLLDLGEKNDINKFKLNSNGGRKY